MAITDLIPWKKERSSQVPVKREGEHPLVTFQRDMNRLFDDFFGGFDMTPSKFFEGSWNVFSPRVDVSENDTEIVVSAELPGMEDKDVEVSVSRDMLTISGEKKEEKEEEDKNYYHVERSYGSFQRSIPLPGEVNPDEVEATFKNGVLNVTLPKTEASQRKKITVKGS
jgi:HSP20 family protein